MTDSSKFPRYVVIHGHFYQPPRENPWTGTIEKQDSAFPYHDWNERVAWECYIPNGISRVVDDGKKIIDLVNNYAYISFNFGPTLLSWLEVFHRRDYERILKGDERSLKRLGHGNAIAQAYSHRIMPLANRRDKITQVMWGIADFKSRFGRNPEAMWLPETACNLAALEILADCGMKYAILSPTQAERAKPIGSEDWINVSQGTLDPRRPYRCYLEKPSRFIDLFFYDHHLAKDIAFGQLLKDAGTCADRIEGCFDKNAGEPEIVHVATDGESYGHHKAFADMTLAYLVKYELPRRGMILTNYAHYLEKHPPTWEVEIKAGPEGEGTAWSCVHGLGRWKDNCGCGAWSDEHQRWRAPLKRALDWLEEELTFLFEEVGTSLFIDPWKARDAYVSVMLDRQEDNIKRFLETHLKQTGRDDHSVKALKLLELERHAHLMHTSCGWFFSEISGLEAVQNLKYAARAIQLAREVTGRDFENEFVVKLSQAPSNHPKLANGRGVYSKLVMPSVITFDKALVHYAFRLLFQSEPETSRFHSDSIRREFFYEKISLTQKIQLVSVVMTSAATWESVRKVFLTLYVPWPRLVLKMYAKSFGNAEELAGIRDKVSVISDGMPVHEIEQLAGALFGPRSMTLKDLLADEREKVLNRILREKYEKLSQNYRQIFNEFLPILEEFHALGEEMPQEIKAQVEFVVRGELLTWLTRFAQEKDFGILEGVKPILVEAGRHGLEMSSPQTEHLFENLILKEFWLFWKEWSRERFERVLKLVEFARLAGFEGWRYRMENQVFNALVETAYPQMREAEGDDRELTERFLDLAELMNINVKASRKVFEETKSAAPC